MTVFEDAIDQPKKMLNNLKVWLSQAAEYAQAQEFDPEILLQSRLAPDQWPLLRQIQGACDAAKFGAARLSGQTAPEHPDTEQNWEEITARIDKTVAYLDGFSAEDFAGVDEVWVILPPFPDKKIAGRDYLREFAHPNLYFHLNAAYSIMRHNGVKLGKRTYIGSVNFQDL